MSEAVISALITGACAILGQLIVSRQTSKELYAKMDKQSELADARIEAKITTYAAVTDQKIEELSKEVRKHNQFAQRVPVLEAKMGIVEKKLEI